MQIDHTAFFNGYRTAYGKVAQNKITGIELLGRHMELDPELTDLRWAAYMLATVKHECADTWQPITEYGPKAYSPSTAPGPRRGASSATPSPTTAGASAAGATCRSPARPTTRR